MSTTTTTTCSCERPNCTSPATHEVLTPWGSPQMCATHAALLERVSWGDAAPTSSYEREWLLVAMRYGPHAGPERRGWLHAVQAVGGASNFVAMVEMWNRLR